MPVYEFKTKSGDVEEVFLTFAQHDKRVKDDWILLDDGRPAKRVWGGGESLRHRSVATTPGNYPMVCTSAGVHPAQVREQQAVLKAAGVRTTQYTKGGDPIFEDKSHRREALTAMGMFDRNSGYSDPAPVHRTKNCKSFLR